MLRIVGVQRGGTPDSEFVLLQNQGIRRIGLKGYAVTDDAYFEGDPYLLASRLQVFSEEVFLITSNYVALFTGHGQNGWRKNSDGSSVYLVYWGRDCCVWSHSPDSDVHLLNISATHHIPKETIFRTMTTQV
ncbi:MAG: hypothetical protein WCO51_06770 [bacterium]|jgi:hypothetical protein